MKNAKPYVKPNWKSYLNQKGIFNYGIPTAVLCLIIYYFLRGEDMLFTAIGADLWIPVFVTVFICALTAIPGVASDVKKGKAPEMPLNKDIHPVFQHLSDNTVIQSLQFAFFATLIFAMIPGGIFAVIASMAKNPDLSISANLYWVLKSLYSGIFVAATLKRVTYTAVAQRQKTMGQRVY